MIKYAQLLSVSIFLFASCQISKKEIYQHKPNIIYILADDLGYGDSSCYGQTHFETHNIDKLASNGMKFTQHYSGSTVCAPSRSSLMTGQHNGHTSIRGNKEVQPEGQYQLEAEAYTLVEALQDAGYVTGAVDKWGLGYPGSEGDPSNQVFDEFFGYNCQRIAHQCYPYHLWHNQEKIMLEGNEGFNTEQYGPDVIHEQALKFLEDNNEKPLFMFYPLLIPHAELFAPEEYMEKYRGEFAPGKSYEGVYGGKFFRKNPFGSQPDSHAVFAAMINLLDDQMGEIIIKLKDLGIYENTLIIFTFENGPHLAGGGDPDYFNSNGIFKGYKRDLYEGGIRVPMVSVWEGKIDSRTETDHIFSFWNVFPTFVELKPRVEESDPPKNYADMAEMFRTGKEPRSHQSILNCVSVLEALEKSAETEKWVEVEYQSFG